MSRQRRGQKSTDGSIVPTGQIRIGPAGWSYQDWNGLVYPTHRDADFHEAAYLAGFFDTIEINT